MITVQDRIFKLDTKNTSYVFAITDKGHAEHIHYGKRLAAADVEALRLKNTIVLGTTVDYDETLGYSLDTLPQEYSGIGKGDFRHAPLELIMPDGSFVTDFVYSHHEIVEGAYKNEDSGLPYATGDAQTLILTLKDRKYPKLTLKLAYSVFEECDVIGRNAELVNEGCGEVYIRKLMSFMMDMPKADYTMLTLDGGWAKEAHAHEREVSYGLLVNDSTTGGSSNRHNPAFMLKEKGCCELWGNAYAFNLVYSGNHYSAVEKTNHDTMRVMSGINPHCFLWKLKQGERFATPEAVMS
ncbi:MAG: alpha-galactosidase, partial [Clostridia bacterium]|nr:alpha-galactosidase [Clostridia bacterium]